MPNIVSKSTVIIASVSLSGAIACGICILTPGVLSILGQTALKHTSSSVLSKALKGSIGGGILIGIAVVSMGACCLAGVVAIVALRCISGDNDSLGARGRWIKSKLA